MGDRKRWKLLADEMCGFTVGDLTPETSSVSGVYDAPGLQLAVLYACGLQGDVGEAKTLAGNIGHVRADRDGAIYVMINRPVTDEEADNLLQAFKDVLGANGNVHIVAWDSAQWHAVKPK